MLVGYLCAEYRPHGTAEEARKCGGHAGEDELVEELKARARSAATPAERSAVLNSLGPDWAHVAARAAHELEIEEEFGYR